MVCLLTNNLDIYTNEHTGIEYNKHVGPHYCPAEMYAGLVACSPWDSQTDGQKPERYITLSAMESAVLLIYCFQICNAAGRRAQMSADN